jgi:hypothetical protein|tara:strand:+ start:155 stop:490 length:336 start_codon:yes stop_codon:yes gene_type:complete
MDIEPLKSYLQNRVKTMTLIKEFLDDDTAGKIRATEYIERGFFIDDKLFFVKRNTLELEYTGKVYCIDGNRIGVKLSQYRNVTLDSKKYYIFRKLKEKTKREIMEELLETL